MISDYFKKNKPVNETVSKNYLLHFYFLYFIQFIFLFFTVMEIGSIDILNKKISNLEILIKETKNSCSPKSSKG